jgi:RNA polymerase sigma-70 factor (ECF subfamily)
VSGAAVWGSVPVVLKPRALPGLVLERAEDTLIDGAETRLVEGMRRGDPGALEELAARELPRVERLLVRLLGRRPDLEDCVQTVFLEACRALPGFRGESTLSTFIAGITVRIARRAMRPTAWLLRRTQMEEEPEDVRPGPEDQAYRAEQLRRTRRALERIAPKKRVAFLLWAVEGLPPEEIAKVTGSSPSAVRSQIFYAQKELRARAAHDPYLKELVGAGGDRP